MSRLRALAPDPNSQDASVRCLGSIFVPDDEVVFHLFDAASATAVRTACERAQLAFERVVESRVTVRLERQEE